MSLAKHLPKSQESKSSKLGLIMLIGTLQATKKCPGGFFHHLHYEEQNHHAKCNIWRDTDHMQHYKIQKMLITTQHSFSIANNRRKAKSKLPLRAYPQKNHHKQNPAIPHVRNKKHNWIIYGLSSQAMSWWIELTWWKEILLQMLQVRKEKSSLFSYQREKPWGRTTIW